MKKSIIALFAAATMVAGVNAQSTDDTTTTTTSTTTTTTTGLGGIGGVGLGMTALVGGLIVAGVTDANGETAPRRPPGGGGETPTCNDGDPLVDGVCVGTTDTVTNTVTVSGTQTVTRTITVPVTFTYAPSL